MSGFFVDLSRVFMLTYFVCSRSERGGEMSGIHGLQPSGWIHRRPDPRHLLQGVTIVTSSSRSIAQHSLNIAMHISSVQFLDRLDPWNNMRDGPGKIFFQSFLREAIASSSGMGRNVHSLTLSIPLFPPANHGFVHPPRCREGWFREAVVEHTYTFSSFSWTFFFSNGGRKCIDKTACFKSMLCKVISFFSGVVSGYLIISTTIQS